MVVNPKYSNAVMGWCVESALNLIFDATVFVGKKIDRSGLFDFFKDNLQDQTVTHHQISRVVFDIKRNNYLDFDNSDSVVFTNKAKMKIVDRFVNLTQKDGRYMLVSFDIPEIKRVGRNNFRRAIKRMGFRQIQKSLWVTDRNVGDLVEAAAVEYKVNEYVAYFVAEKSNIDQFIQNILKH